MLPISFDARLCNCDWFTDELLLAAGSWCDIRTTAQSKMKWTVLSLSSWSVFFLTCALILLFAASFLLAGLWKSLGDNRQSQVNHSSARSCSADLSSSHMLPCVEPKCIMFKPVKLAQIWKCSQYRAMHVLKYRAGGSVCGCICYSAQDVHRVWLTLFLWSHFFVFGVAELEQEVRCIIHRSVSMRSEWLRLRIFFPLSFCCACGGRIRAILCRCDMTFGLSWCRFVSFCLDSISLLTCSHSLSTELEWKFSHLSFSVLLLSVSVACSSFLCLPAVW